MQSDVIDNILDTPSGKKALSNAVKNVQNELSLVAKPDAELTQIAREVGAIAKGEKVSKGLSLRTLDYVKRSLDDDISTALRNDAGEAKRLIALKRGLTGELDRLDKTGAYAKARKVSGDYLSNRDAMEEGVKILNPGYMADDLQKSWASKGKTERESMRVGLMRGVRKMIDNAKDGSDVSRRFDTQAIRDKMQTILTKDQYSTLMKEIESTGKIYKLRNEILGGSPTASKQVAARQFANEGAELAEQVAQQGATRTLIDKGLLYAAKKVDGLSDKLAGEVAEILTETDPIKKLKILTQLRNQAKKGGSIQTTDAGKKLRAFFEASDVIDEIRLPSAIPAAGAGAGVMSNEKALPTPSPQPKLTPVDYNPFEGMESQQPITVPEMPVSTQPTVGDDTIKEHEGLRLGVYNDTVGKKTIGHGFNMQSGIARKVWERAGVQTPFKDALKGEATITPQEAEALFIESRNIAAEDAKRVYPRFDSLPDSRKEALMSLSYQLGLPKLKSMTTFNNAINRGDLNIAIKSLRNTQLAKQTPERVNKIIKLLARGT